MLDHVALLGKDLGADITFESSLEDVLLLLYQPNEWQEGQVVFLLGVGESADALLANVHRFRLFPEGLEGFPTHPASRVSVFFVVSKCTSG